MATANALHKKSGIHLNMVSEEASRFISARAKVGPASVSPGRLGGGPATLMIAVTAVGMTKSDHGALHGIKRPAVPKK
jgi:hypothetical protein